MPTLLVIDDDAALVRMIRLTFQSDGFTVLTAHDGQEALETVRRSGSIDAVVLDLQMPGMDGRTFYRELRARGHNVPTVVLSAYGAEAARRELGADAAVAKPFDPGELVLRVQRLIDDAGRAAE